MITTIVLLNSLGWCRFQRGKTGRAKCIFITGGASGIGLLTALKFLKEGWFVGVYDLNVENVTEKMIEKEPLLEQVIATKMIAMQMDVTDVRSCEDGLQHFLKATDNYMDVLFNCAGVLCYGPFAEESLFRQRKQIEVNCTGVMQMTHLSLEALKKTKDSVVISMASVAAVGGCPNCGVYASTKSFVYSFTEALRSEITHAYGVHACDVSVLFVDTPMVQSQNINHYTKLFQQALKNIKPEELAEKVYYAVHDCSYHRVHYYVREAGFLFFADFLSRALCETLRTTVLDSISLLPRQKAGYKPKPN